MKVKEFYIYMLLYSIALESKTFDNQYQHLNFKLPLMWPTI